MSQKDIRVAVENQPPYAWSQTLPSVKAKGLKLACAGRHETWAVSADPGGSRRILGEIDSALWHPAWRLRGDKLSRGSSRGTLRWNPLGVWPRVNYNRPVPGPLSVTFIVHSWLWRLHKLVWSEQSLSYSKDTVRRVSVITHHEYSELSDYKKEIHLVHMWD